MIINFSNLGGGGGGSYTLPIASSSVLGGVKIGSGVTIDSAGTISVEVADSSVLKGVAELPMTGESGDVRAVKGQAWGRNWDYQGGGDWYYGITDTANTAGLSQVILGEYTDTEGNTAHFGLVWDSTYGWMFGFGQDISSTAIYTLDALQEESIIVDRENEESFEFSVVFDGYEVYYLDAWVSSDEGVTFINPSSVPSVYQYDGSQWNEVGANGAVYTAGDYITIDSANTISVTGLTTEEHSEEVEAIIAGAMGELNKNVGQIPFKQNRIAVSSEAEMNALTGVSEGDVCTVPGHVVPLSSEQREQVYNYLVNYGFNDPLQALIDMLGYRPEFFTITLVENPNWDEVDRYSTDDYTCTRINYEGNSYGRYGYGIRYSGGQYEWIYQTNNYREGQFPTDNWRVLEPNTPVIMEPCGEEWQIYNTNSPSYPGYMYESVNNAAYPYFIRIDTYVGNKTYQYNNGAWIELASAAGVSSALTVAQNAYNTANSKLNHFNMDIEGWNSLLYYDDFIGQLTINNVPQGTRIHPYGAVTEYTNPRVDQITTSNSFLRFIKLTQDEYEAIQNPDPLVCYIIVEEE